jgi:hypothetical protein
MFGRVQEEVGEKGRDVGNCCLAYGRGKNKRKQSRGRVPNGRAQKEVCDELNDGGRCEHSVRKRTDGSVE